MEKRPEKPDEKEKRAKKPDRELYRAPQGGQVAPRSGPREEDAQEERQKQSISRGVEISGRLTEAMILFAPNSLHHLLGEVGSDETAGLTKQEVRDSIRAGDNVLFQSEGMEKVTRQVNGESVTKSIMVERYAIVYQKNPLHSIAFRTWDSGNTVEVLHVGPGSLY